MRTSSSTAFRRAACAQVSPRNATRHQLCPRNRAHTEAKGEIIVYGDDDMMMKAIWFRELTQPFVNDHEQKVGVVAGEVIPVFPDGCLDWARSFHTPQALRDDMGPTSTKQVSISTNLAFRRDALCPKGRVDTNVGRKGKRVFAGEENGPMHRMRQAGFEVWFAPLASVDHQMPSGRTTISYVKRHAFDSACSRVVGRVNLDLDSGRSSISYLVSRFLGNILKALGFTLIALVNLLLLRRGEAKKSLVRAWRSCGYLYQIPQSLWS